MSYLRETSSGGIVYRINSGRIEILLIERKTNNNSGRQFVLPKGHFEGEEKAKDTALREIAEESGLAPEDLEIIKFITKVNYTFVATHMDGSPTINKDVYLFLVKYTGSARPRLTMGGGESRMFVGIGWYDLEEVRSLPIKPDIAEHIDRNLHYIFPQN